MDIRKRGRTLKKRHGLLVAITFFVWLLIGLMIVFIDPENMRDLIFYRSYFLPGVLIYLGLLFLLSILTLSARRAFLWSRGLVIFIYLRVWGLGNYLNLLLLLGVVGSIETYISLNN